MPVTLQKLRKEQIVKVAHVPFTVQKFGVRTILFKASNYVIRCIN